MPKINKRGFIVYGNKRVPMAGKAKWAHLLEPNTRFDDDGVYCVDFVTTEDDAEEFINMLQSYIDENMEAIKKNAKGKKFTIKDFYEEELNEDDEPTGNIVFKFKQNAKFTWKGKTKTNKVALADSSGKKATGLSSIGNGSKIKVIFEPSVWYMPSSKEAGVTLRLKAVQILELIEYGDDAGDMFEDEGDGYVAGDTGSDDSDYDFDGGGDQDDDDEDLDY